MDIARRSSPIVGGRELGLLVDHIVESIGVGGVIWEQSPVFTAVQVMGGEEEIWGRSVRVVSLVMRMGCGVDSLIPVQR